MQASTAWSGCKRENQWLFCFITFCYNSSTLPSSSSSSIFSAIAVKPKLSLLSLPSTYTPLKALKPSRSYTFRVFAAPEVLDSQETLDGPDSATTEVGGSVDPGSSPLSIGADAEKMALKQKIRIKLGSYWVRLIEDSCKQITDAARTTSAKTMGPVLLPIKKRIYCVLNLHMSTKMPGLTFPPRLMWKSSSEKGLLQL
ncbi:unnamed protein product [Camellia sinensis]